MTEACPQFKQSKIAREKNKNHKLKQRYDYFKARFDEVSKRASASLPRTIKAQRSILQEALMSSINQLNLYKKEKEFYIRKQLKIPKISLNDLELEKKTLKQKIQHLKSENSSLKTPSEIEYYSQSSEKTIKLAYEISCIKKKITELQQTHDKNQKIIKILEDQTGDFGITANAIINENESNRLSNYEKNLKYSLKKNQAKYKQKIKELEEEEQKCNYEKVCLQMKILKSNQQERLLEITLCQQRENVSDFRYADANFLYKPSIRALYY